MDSTQTPTAATAATAVPAGKPEETVRLVNTGRADYAILPGRNGVLKRLSGNVLEVPKPLADKLRRSYPKIKNVNDIFPDSVDAAKLKADNEALRLRASALEGLLEESSKKAAAEKGDVVAKADAAVKASADRIAELESKVADLSARLKAFIEADKKDLPALQKEHAEAVKASA